MKNLTCRLAVLFILSFTVLFAAEVCAESVGRIEKTGGKALVVRSNGTELEAKVGLELAPGDQVKTGKGGLLWFSINGTGQFKLSGESQMAIDELSESKSEDVGISLRMVVGYLTSKIRKIQGNTAPVMIHTSTATIGVRGTEFDTTAAIDGSSAVAVDEGLVEVETEGGQFSLSQGKMSEVDADGKSSGPAQATSRESREGDWETWRQKREEAMIQFLPVRIPKMRARFERGTEMFARFNARLSEASEKLHTSMAEFKKAKAEGRGARLFHAKRNLRKDFVTYKLMVLQFRKGMNRIRISAAQVGRIKVFVYENKSRFSAQDMEIIIPNLEAISTHSEQLVKGSTETMRGIRQTFVDLIEMRKEMLEDDAAGSQQENPGGQGRFQRQGPLQRNFRNR